MLWIYLNPYFCSQPDKAIFNLYCILAVGDSPRWASRNNIKFTQKIRVFKLFLIVEKSLFLKRMWENYSEYIEIS